MVAFTLIGQLGLPDGTAGHENQALTWVGPGPQDYELSPANAGSVEAVDITDSTSTGRALIVAASAAAAQTAIGATTVGKAVIVAADMAAARTAIGAGTSNLAIGTSSSTAKAGDYTPTKTDVGLANVDNTSDANKPVSTATTTALAGKEPSITVGTSAQYYRGDKTMQTLNKAAVGLSSVDNTTDLGKPISTAQQTALDLKADDSSVVKLTGTQTVAGAKTFSGASTFSSAATFSSTVTVPNNAFTTAKVSGLVTTLAGIDDSITALQATSSSALLIIKWDSTIPGYPDQAETAPAGVTVRHFLGPEAYAGPTFAGIDDVYFYRED